MSPGGALVCRLPLDCALAEGGAGGEIMLSLEMSSRTDGAT